MTDERISNRPIELSEVESFVVNLTAPQRTDPMGPHRHRAKKALDMEDKEVPAEDLEALRWIREKKGLIELGKAYVISKFSEALQTPYKLGVAERPVMVEVPVFYPGASAFAVGAGPTLSVAVEATKASIKAMGDVKTYPEFSAGLDRVLLKVGKADLRVADLCALIRDYMEEEPTGGALHCSLSDGNMEGDLLWEVDFWRDRNGVDDKEARLIGELLMLMTSEERKALYERGYGR